MYKRGSQPGFSTGTGQTGSAGNGKGNFKRRTCSLRLPAWLRLCTARCGRCISVGFSRRSGCGTPGLAGQHSVPALIRERPGHTSRISDGRKRAATTVSYDRPATARATTASPVPTVTRRVRNHADTGLDELRQRSRLSWSVLVVLGGFRRMTARDRSGRFLPAFRWNQGIQ